MAGGLNLYGFAGGDPVNYTDPFGLCPIEKDGVPCTAYYAPGVKVSSAELHAALDAIAAEVDRPLMVYGGDRSVQRNKEVGGAQKSEHLEGMAADVIFDGMSKAETFKALAGSQVRKDFGVRLIYHGPGAELPEHSHLDMRGGQDLREQPKGSSPRYIPIAGKQGEHQ